MNGISLFSGIGGLDLGLKEAAGVRTVCYVEWDKYCQEVLKKRMQEGFLDDAPIWSDICSFDGKRWAGRVDIVFGGFPCQDISIAGKGAGIKVGTRSGLFYELMRVVSEIRPPYLFLENVSAITNRGIDIVLGELAKEGYDARWEIVSAAEVGAPHRRERWFCLAYPTTERLQDSRQTRIRQLQKESKGRLDVESSDGCIISDAFNKGLQGGMSRDGWKESFGLPSGELWNRDPADFPRTSESFVGRVAYGIPKRVDRLKCLGNAVVSRQAAEAWKRLTKDLENTNSIRL